MLHTVEEEIVKVRLGRKAGRNIENGDEVTMSSRDVSDIG